MHMPIGAPLAPHPLTPPAPIWHRGTQLCIPHPLGSFIKHSVVAPVGGPAGGNIMRLGAVLAMSMGIGDGYGVGVF